MESFFKLPEPLSLDENVADQWKRFKQKFELYSVATALETKSAEKQIAVFLSLVGEEGLELYNSFSLSAADGKSLVKIKEKFDEYCSPKKNITFERFKFNSITQKEGQSFDNFLTELRKAIKSTEYKDQDDMLKDRIVIGILDKTTQERLLRDTSLSLEKAVTFCRTVEMSKQQSKALQSEVSVNALRKGRENKGKWTEKQTNNESRNYDCKYCGYKHRKGKCPAYGKPCDNCKGKHHFAAVCRKKTESGNSNKKNTKKVNELTKAEESDDSSSEFFVGSLVKSVGAIRNERKSGGPNEFLWRAMRLNLS